MIAFNNIKIYPVCNRWTMIGNNPVLVKMDFKKVNLLDKFINNDIKLVKYNGNFLKVEKIKKIKHFSIEAIVHLITLREYNLERLIGGNKS